jgi:hypothetical protein
MLALLPISQYRPRDVSPQHNVITRFGRRAPVRLAVGDTFNEALLWQQVNLDAKQNVIQQQETRALIHNSAAHCDLRVISPAALGNFVAPRAIIPVETDQPRTWIDIQLLRYIGVAPKKSPTKRKVNQPPFANLDIDCDEVTNVLMDVLLHGIAPIDAGTDLAENLVPRAPDLRVQVATQWSQEGIAIANSLLDFHPRIQRRAYGSFQAVALGAAGADTPSRCRIQFKRLSWLRPILCITHSRPVSCIQLLDASICRR